MKLKKILIYIIFIIILGIIAYTIFNISKDKRKDDKVTRGQLAKAIALSLFTQEECDNNEKNYFEEGDESWYTSYMNKLYNQEILNRHIFSATKKSALRVTSYSDLESVINNLDIDKKEIRKITDKYKGDDELRISVFSDIYKILISKLDSENKINLKNINLIKINEEGIYNTTDGELYASGIDLQDYIDNEIEVFVKGDEIILMASLISEDVNYKNVFIEKYQDGKLYTFINGAHREFKIKGIEEAIKDTIADLNLENKKLEKITLKMDTIRGKVLEIDNEGVEIERYAKLEFTEDFKVYKNYGNTQMKNPINILVGYDTTDFVVADGKICAAIITKDIDAKNIRVLLKTNAFENLFHGRVVITSEDKFKASFGDQTQIFEAGQEIEITGGSNYLAQGRVKVVPESSDGKLIIKTLDRSYGTPAYRGSIEVSSGKNGLIIVNELPIEEYLYSVIPSEMPTSYGLEALYVQSVCARTYAYKQLLKNEYSHYGAHVDDSVSFQVYNNIEENELSISAAKETYGKILTHEDEVIEAFFFSTSAGSTTDASVWGNGNLPYIKGRVLNEGEKALDLTNNDEFDKFIRQNYDTYDSQFPWYRWSCSISLDTLTQSINNNIGKRYSLNPNNILTLSANGNYVCSSISSIGRLKKIEIAKRSTGGVISELILHGSDRTVLVKTEGNIRNLINVYGIDILKHDGSVTNTSKNLPSAYFTLDEVSENGVLSAYKFTGGGFGHGVGVSQNAVKAMTEAGIGWEEILSYFYNEVELSDI